QVPSLALRPLGTRQGAVGVLVAVDQAGDADHGAGGQLPIADRAGDQRNAQDGPVDLLTRVLKGPDSPTASHRTILDRLVTGQYAGGVRLLDADAADPVALGQGGSAHGWISSHDQAASRCPVGGMYVDGSAGVPSKHSKQEPRVRNGKQCW